MIGLEQIGQVASFLRDERKRLGRDGPFDIAIHGISPGDDPDRAAQLASDYARAGVTWWNELLERPDTGFAPMRERVLQGPPRLG